MALNDGKKTAVQSPSVANIIPLDEGQSSLNNLMLLGEQAGEHIATFKNQAFAATRAFFQNNIADDNFIQRPPTIVESNNESAEESDQGAKQSKHKLKAKLIGPDDCEFEDFFVNQTPVIIGGDSFDSLEDADSISIGIDYKEDLSVLTEHTFLTAAQTFVQDDESSHEPLLGAIPELASKDISAEERSTQSRYSLRSLGKRNPARKDDGSEIVLPEGHGKKGGGIVDQSTPQFETPQNELRRRRRLRLNENRRG